MEGCYTEAQLASYNALFGMNDMHIIMAALISFKRMFRHMSILLSNNIIHYKITCTLICIWFVLCVVFQTAAGHI